MTPRVRPRHRPADAVRAARRAALDRGVEPRSVPDERDAEALLEQARAVRQIDPSVGPEPYRDNAHSWFLDQAIANAPNEVAREFIVPPNVGSVQAARSRLAVARGPEKRDLSTAVTAGGNFAPSGSPPSYVSDIFATAARPRAVLAEALNARPIPLSGMTISTPRIDSPGTVAIQPDGDAVSEGSATTAIVESNVATVAGQLDVSQQLFDRSDPGIDEVISAELGAAWGAALDVEIVTRLLALSGITAVTASTATAAGNLIALGKLTGDTTIAAGVKPDLLAMHPRRATFIRVTGTLAPVPWPIERVLEAPGIPIAVGGTQDVMLALVSAQVIPFTSQPSISVMADVLSGALTVRVSVYSYLALVVRQPTGVGKASGPGLAAPTWAGA